MSRSSWRQRIRDRLAATPGVAAVRRPVTPRGAAEFDLYYVRTGPPSVHPVLVIPGGPGLASVQPYRAFREHAAARGLDVIMVEHRGVGLSRHTDDGADLPEAAITVDQVVADLAAVLDAAGVDRATVYGTSYGGYLAAGLGVRQPRRVRSMVLDSPVLSARDIHDVREAIRELLLAGTGPTGAALAAKARALVDRGLLDSTATQLAATVYEFGGVRALDRQLDLLLSGRTVLWRIMELIGEQAMRVVPFHNEVDLVNRIAFRELDYRGTPDGLPLDPSVGMGELAEQMPGAAPDFEEEPYDLVAEMPRFDWPTVVLSGGRDLTTPPAIAARVADLIPGAVPVRLPTAGHSILDTRERAAIRVAAAVTAGGDDIAELARRGTELDALPGNATVRLAALALDAGALLGRVSPVRLPR